MLLFIIEIGRILRLFRLGGSALASLLAARLRGKRLTATNIAPALRVFLERMGLTYVKLGQFLATRNDLLPPEICDELGRLFQRVPPMSLPQVFAQLDRGLGRPHAELFASFDPKPLGAASVAQVHRAVTNDGRPVAVKVQRPGVSRIFAADMRILTRLAHVAAALGVEIGFDAPSAAREFAGFTARELDFRIEAATATRVRGQNDSRIFVPKVHPDLSSATILTLDLIEGESLSEIYERLDAGERPPRDLGVVANTLAQAMFRQMFVMGFFHGDPHPGNIMLDRHGRIALVDFGIFGELSHQQLGDVTSYVRELASGDVGRAFDHYAAMTVQTSRSDPETFRREALEVLVAWRDASGDPHAAAGETQIATVAARLLRVLRNSRIALKLDTLLFWRAVILLDANFSRNGIDFDLNTALQEFFAGQTGGVDRQIAAKLMRLAAGPDLADLAWASSGRLGRILARSARRARIARTGDDQSVAVIVAALSLPIICLVCAVILY